MLKRSGSGDRRRRLCRLAAWCRSCWRPATRSRVLDLYLYGDDLFADLRGPNLTEVKGDLRDAAAVKRAVTGCDAVIHLACISNDPSLRARSRARQVDQLRLLPAAGARRQGRRRQALHLRLVVERLRHQGRAERHRGAAARAADRLFEVQGDVRGGAGAGARARLHHASPCARRPCAATRRACGST